MGKVDSVCDHVDVKKPIIFSYTYVWVHLILVDTCDIDSTSFICSSNYTHITTSQTTVGTAMDEGPL
jgi:hypothetical protein